MENALPSLCSDKLSRIFGGAGPASKSGTAESSGTIVPPGAKPRKAQATPTAVKKARVRKPRQAGHSLSEIAKMVGVSPGTSEVRLHRARKLLRKRLERSR